MNSGLLPLIMSIVIFIMMLFLFIVKMLFKFGVIG